MWKDAFDQNFHDPRFWVWTLGVAALGWAWL